MPESVNETKRGVVAEVIFHNDENGYTVAVFDNEAEDEEFIAVGCLPDCGAGRTYELKGAWKVHPSYGEQFAFTEASEVMPETAEGIEEFLASGVLKGIGIKTAALIVSRFGKDTLNVIADEPERLTEISGIGPKKAALVSEAFRAHREFADIAMFFRGLGISVRYAMKLYKVYGPDTIEMVRQNPYRLVDDVFGIGFRKADAIALKMGIARDDENRIMAGVKYVLTYYAGEGNTYVPQRELREKVAELLETDAESVDDAVISLTFRGEVQIEKLEDRTVVFLMPYYMAEKNVCRNLVALNTADLLPLDADIDSLIRFTEATAEIVLSENQKYAVRTCLGNGVSVITGGPGTGKTTIINAVMNVLAQSGCRTAIAAPTGRAAKRITETSGFEASTIHRLLEYTYAEDGDDTTLRFGRNAENPLEYEAVIVDEASMIDILLMNALTNALKPGTRLVLVGDADQLPPVGAGNVLRDIIDSEYVYCVKLTEIFRQAAESMIVVNAHRINRGEYPDLNVKDKDFFMLRRKGEKEILELIKDLCVRRLPAFYEGCDAVRDIQVLTPVRKGTLGCVNLNIVLQEAVNPPAPGLAELKHGDRVFRENDKVMQIKNNYDTEWRRASDLSEGAGVFNGDVGFVLSVDRDTNRLTVVFDEDKYVTYEYSQLEELEHAYAVTVHKSQGSEFPIVVMPVSWFPPMLATRNLLYTAVTRGKTAVVLAGDEQKLYAMVDNDRISERYSGLSARLRAFLETDGGDFPIS